MMIPIDTEPLKALDVPTRWLLSEALDDAYRYANLQATNMMDDNPALPEIERKRDTYRQIAEAIR